ncbi:7885_t:CDS:2 [Funneliformis geosporum]|uniref:7885_t:CDS:1 n=1 Tax=Funneliformis geosporum TaxID=1117311 RepID=A0A9W4SZA0_9GLOM|nr:7885_t:CDS:2 [Funneliformis geosporum]
MNLDPSLGQVSPAYGSRFIFLHHLNLITKCNKKGKRQSSQSKVDQDSRSTSMRDEETVSDEEMNVSSSETPPLRLREITIITPQKSTLYEHTANYLSKHFSLSFNQQCVIMKVNQFHRKFAIGLFLSEKDKFKPSVLATFNSDHLCEYIRTLFSSLTLLTNTLFQLSFSMSSEAFLNRNIGKENTL